jgi:ABC-type sulfate transport system permease component
LAFAAIVFAGISGSLIGWSLVRLQCHGACAAPESIGVFVGGVGFALGVAVVAVLALRAMAEWRGQLELDD